MAEPEQTDHRAEAEHWAALAAREYSRSLEHAVPAALIGIGHWLGAHHDSLLALLDINDALLALAVSAAPQDDEQSRMGVSVLDELLPTRTTVPTGSFMYQPSLNEHLAHVDGRWWRVPHRTIPLTNVSLSPSEG